MSGLDWAVPLLVCPVCHGALTLEREASDPRHGRLAHRGGVCAEVYPVIDGIPRLLVGGLRGVLARDRAAWFGATAERRAAFARGWMVVAQDDAVVRGFDTEWERFPATRSAELRRVFDMYFDIVPAALVAPTRTVLDAGCGAGRWAIELASRGPRVLAVDLGRSVEVARRNAADDDRVACVQADLRRLPLREAAVDWAYSLGVLHHLDRPEGPLADVVRAVRPGGAVLLYLYYALERRGRLFRAVFRTIDAVRRVTSRLPRPPVIAFSTAVAVFLYWPLARASALLHALGLRSIADAMPLSFYRERSLTIMRNDSLDRFGTTVEHRYDRPAMERLMRGAGLDHVRFSDGPPFWHAIGTRS